MNWQSARHDMKHRSKAACHILRSRCKYPCLKQQMSTKLWNEILE